MPNNDVKIDHEAAKRYAAYIGDMARDHVCGQDDVNLSAAYLDAMARLDKAEKAGESWKDAYFKLIRAIGSSPNCSKSPVSIAQELLAQRDEAEKLRGVAYGLLDVAVKERDEALALLERVTDDELGGTPDLFCPDGGWEQWWEKVRAFRAKHRNTGANHGK